MQFQISCQKTGEFWWYGITSKGFKMPVNSATDSFYFDARFDNDYNQVCTLLVSDCGRYLYVDGTCIVEIGNDAVRLSDYCGEVDFGEGYASLEEAYLAAAGKHFYHARKTVPEKMVLAPQYCTWVETLFEINQRSAVEYAENIVKAGFPKGILIFDCGWQSGYGDWTFDLKKFPDPKTVCDRIHQLGFSVILWICPFVNRDMPAFAELEQAGAFVKTSNGETAMRTWWNDTSAVLDLSSPAAYAWIKEQMEGLMQEYGVDGFKMDAGDMEYYRADDQTYASVSPQEQCKLWAKLASEFEYSELRACVNMSGYPIVQRLCDKDSSWDKERGIGALIPDMITAGLAGYAYCCPDMIGGGQEMDFKDGRKHDFELFVRSAQCAALMPMMQFSYAIWSHCDNEKTRAIVRECANLRLRYREAYLSLLDETKTTFAPMLRCMEYAYPKQGLQTIQDQFLLGKDLLVAPVLTLGERERRVVLPSGDDWTYVPTGKTYCGGQTVIVPAPIETLPYFERVKE